MSQINQLYTEVFRCKSLDNMYLPDRVKNEVSKGLVQNTFLYGSAGTGKTTIAKILTDGYEVLHLNGSSENGIDIIRNKVVSFASTISILQNQEAVKVVFIDEADGLTDAAWDALRETIEHYAGSVRFICTCNKIDKIPMPIKSRFNLIAVYPINKEEEEQVLNGYFSFVRWFFDGVKIKASDEFCWALVRKYCPDMRSILNTLQAIKTGGAEEVDEKMLLKSFDGSEIFNLILNGDNPVENYKFVMENYSSMPDEAMDCISKNFINFILDSHPEYAALIPYWIITIAEYMQMMPTASDKIVVLLACIFKLQFIKSKTVK